MHRQGLLPLFADTALREVWVRLPEEQRREIVVLYARLAARAAKNETLKETKEGAHEATDP